MVAVGAVAESDLYAEPRPRGTTGDRERRRREEEEREERAGADYHQEVVDGQAGAGARVTVEDPTKVIIGKGKGDRRLEVCRVMNGLCQVRDRDGDCCGDAFKIPQTPKRALLVLLVLLLLLLV